MALSSGFDGTADRCGSAAASVAAAAAATANLVIDLMPLRPGDRAPG